MAPDTSPSIFNILKSSAGDWTVVFSGSLNINTAAVTLNTLTPELKKTALTSLIFDFEKIVDIDDYGALVLYELKNEACHRGIDFKILNSSKKLRSLMAHIEDRLGSNNSKKSQLTSFPSGSNLVIHAGEAAIENFKSIKYFIAFIGSLVMSTLRIFQKPKSLRVDDIIHHMKTTGVDAVPVVALISFLLGLIMAFMSSLQLKQFGANIYVASLVALAMVSELGPIMTAIIVSGRSGSAFAAEISTMKISEEIDALLTMGFDPVLFLAIPRIIAAIIVIPLLTMFANLFAISGGLLIGITMLDLSVTSYISQTINSLNLFELFWGLSKSLVFAILISGVGCLRGFQAKGGASSVGHAATSAVVTSIFLIVLFDSLFAVIRSYWG